MKFRNARCFVFILIVIMLFTGCSPKRTYDKSPLMGLSWFSGMEQSKAALSSLELIGERENNGVKLMDYDGATLFEMNMNVTLCYKDEALIGVSYHDVNHNQSFLKWQEQIEDNYGIPNENGVESASWFENPIGENTSVYLFDLAEGVQISFFGTADTPDKTFNKRDCSVIK